MEHDQDHNDMEIVTDDSSEVMEDDQNLEEIIIDKEHNDDMEEVTDEDDNEELDEEELEALDEQQMIEETNRRLKIIHQKYANLPDQRKVLSNFNDGVICVAMSKNGNYVAGGSCDNSYALCECNGKLIKNETYENTVSGVAFNHDESLLALCSYDSCVRVVDVNGTVRHTFDGSDEFEWVKFHPFGNIVIAGSVDGAIWLWNADTGKTLTTLHCGIPCLIGDTTPDGKAIVAGYEDGSIRIWSPKTQTSTKMSICKPNESVEITSLSIHNKLPLGVVGSAIGDCHIFNTNTSKILSSFKSDNEDTSVETVAINSLHSTFAFSGSLDGAVRMFDVDTGHCVHKFIHSEDELSVTKIHTVDGGYVLASFGMDSRVKIWDLRSKNCTSIGKKKIIVTGSEDNTMALFSLQH
ncbi:Angio-associated migratory cell protein [Entamoeba marina]